MSGIGFHDTRTACYIPVVIYALVGLIAVGLAATIALLVVRARR
jgi:hypothetical protein